MLFSVEVSFRSMKFKLKVFAVCRMQDSHKCLLVFVCFSRVGDVYVYILKMY